MSARILDGAAVAAAIRERVAGQVRELCERGVTPRLEVILVGDDPASRSYVAAASTNSGSMHAAVPHTNAVSPRRADTDAHTAATIMATPSIGKYE